MYSILLIFVLILVSRCVLYVNAMRLAPDAAELVTACYFAYTLKLDMPGSNHHTIRGADFQRKVVDFYAGLPVSAPLDEAFWVLALPEHFQDTILKECPTLIVLSYLLVAEAKLYVDPQHAVEFMEIGMSVLRGLEPRLLSMIVESWPVELAVRRFQQSQQSIQNTHTLLPSSSDYIDIVVTHCKEDLGWLQIALPHWAAAGLSRLFIYEKCGQKADVGGMVPTTSVQVIDGPPGGRKDECSAYLTHLVSVAEAGNAAHYTVFLQSDALHHTQVQLLNLVMTSMKHRTFNVPFLHLSRARMVSSTSPCKRAIFEQVIGHAPGAMPNSYCCAQFIARRDAIMQRSASAWKQILAAMDAPLPKGCESVRQGAGMHCLAFESIWHVMFGLNERLSARAEDTTLPVFLRIPEVDGSDLPGGVNSTMYWNNVLAGDSAVEWMDELTSSHVDLTGARSIGYVSAI